MIETLPLHLNINKSAIVRTVLYFDLFNYPLTPQELFDNCGVTIQYADFCEELHSLLEAGLLKKNEEFIQNTTAQAADVVKRRNGNHMATQVMDKAYEYARRISGYPFVEGVYISGALSKNYYDEKGDFDFFIIARPGRLWICRTLLILKYKSLSGRNKKFWCINYFISKDVLKISDENIFTATELATLRPAVNYPLYLELLKANPWFLSFYPNRKPRNNDGCNTTRYSFTKKLIETLLSGRLGETIDNILLKLTANRWRKKYPQMNESDFELQYRSNKSACKRHTRGFQNKVLKLFDDKQKAFEMHNALQLERMSSEK